MWMACAWGVGGEMQNAKCRMQNEGGDTCGQKYALFGAVVVTGEIPNPKFQIPMMRGRKGTECYTFYCDRALGLTNEYQIIA